MICRICGMQNQDDALHCQKCGALLQPEAVAEPAAEPVQQAPVRNKKSKKPWILALCCLVLVVATAVGLILAFGHVGERIYIARLMAVMEDWDEDDFLELFPEGVELTQGDVEDMEESLSEIEDVEYKISGFLKMNDTELEKYTQRLSYNTAFSEADLDITEGVFVWIQLCVEADGEDECTSTVMMLLKSDGKWFLYPGT